MSLKLIGIFYFIHTTTCHYFVFFKWEEKPYGNSTLSRKEVESADKAVAKGLEFASKCTVRAKSESTLLENGVPMQQSITVQCGGLS